MSDSKLRLLQIVSKLPIAPRSISAKQLQSMFRSDGQKVGIRTLQRDLQLLIKHSGLEIEQTKPTGRGKEGVGYCFKSGARTIGPRMDYSSALTLVMANEFVAKLMPETVVQAMQPFVAQAESSLGSDRQKVHAGWRNKVRSVPRYMCFEKPSVAQEVYDAVTTALLEDKCIEITYKEREKPYLLHPLALVDRGLETILVAYVQEYGEHRQFMLHRIRNIQRRTFAVKRPKGFDIDELIASGYFSVPLGRTQHNQIKLKIRLFEKKNAINPRVDITGTPLARDQVIELAEDGRSSTVTATVTDTYELRSWLQGLGARVEVIKPPYLRRVMINNINDLQALYPN